MIKAARTSRLYNNDVPSAGVDERRHGKRRTVVWLEARQFNKSVILKDWLTV